MGGPGAIPRENLRNYGAIWRRFSVFFIIYMLRILTVYYNWIFINYYFALAAKTLVVLLLISK